MTHSPPRLIHSSPISRQLLPESLPAVPIINCFATYLSAGIIIPHAGASTREQLESNFVRTDAEIERQRRVLDAFLVKARNAPRPGEMKIQ